ncbi:MAG TPA: hypothetical protein VN613_01450 [Gemmatimonadaceae bacterium]|nr:hypothetical protein [Gemmatimonadaceae bacterium]
MRKSMLLVLPGALLFAATAGAQRSPASPRTAPAAAHAPGATLPRGAAAAWNGTPSKWGGSPPERAHDHDRGVRGYPGQSGAYIPIAVAAPYPVAAAPDTACAPTRQAAAEMPVIVTPRHEERQLTTIEVYRLQPRFQKP